MPSPTRAEMRTQLQTIIHILEEAREFAESDATNFVGLQDTLTQALEGDYSAEMADGVNSLRGSLSALLSGGSVAVSPWLRNWQRHAVDKDAQKAIDSILEDIYDDFITNSERVTSRQITYGSASAGGGNTGNGTINRLTKDERNYDLENEFVEVKSLKVVNDQNSGTDTNRETFRIDGESAGKDSLEVSGSALRGSLSCRNARDDSLLGNSGFDDFTGTASVPSAITSWDSSITVNDTNFAFDSSNVYLQAPDDNTTVYSLSVKTSCNLTQKLTENGIELDPGRVGSNVPYYLQVAYNSAVNSATGTLELHLGSQSTSVSVTGASGWNILRMPITTNQWYRNFKEDSLDVKLVWTETSAGVGGLLLDDVILVPYDEVDGTYWCAVGGTTPFLLEDSFTFTDTFTATDSVIQKWIWRLFGTYLPHTTGSAVTFTDP